MSSLSRMRVFILAAALAGAFASTSGSAEENNQPQDQQKSLNKPAQLSASETYAFAGYSTVTVDGTGKDGKTRTRGIGGMYAACRADARFGPASRMCTSEEFARSPDITFPKKDAWLQPILGLKAPKYFSGSQHDAACRNQSSNILNWASNSSKGLVISSSGAMRSDAACSVSRPVACCTPR